MATAIQNAGKKAVNGQKNVPVTKDYTLKFIQSLTTDEFKAEVGVVTFDVLHSEEKGKSFMCSKGKSIGAVAREIDLDAELQVSFVIPIEDAATVEGEDDDVSNGFYLLTNRGESTYKKVKTI